MLHTKKNIAVQEGIIRMRQKDKRQKKKSGLLQNYFKILIRKSFKPGMKTYNLGKAMSKITKGINVFL